MRLRADQTAEAGALLRAGRLVALPTETVYGLGANALDGAAVARVYDAKGRPSFNPLIVHVPDLDAALSLAAFDAQALSLAEAFWPGALTLVLPLQGEVAPLVTAGLPTVALRVPSGALAQEVLRAAGVPVAAPSANSSGRISPTTAAHVLEGLDGKIDAVLDGGPCAVGVESTIVGFGPEPQLLRPGGLAAEEIARVLGAPLGVAGAAITAPGQLASHYAPQGRVRLNAEAPRAGEHYLGFGPGPATLTLSDTGDLVEAAANLFGHLHALDALGGDIAVASVPEHGLGVAINDRLRRAAAPRG
jgi:L-threonylcarbamoyladenylate synthase